MMIASNARVLVTGSSGFIGTNLTETLLKAGFTNLLLTDIKAPRIDTHKRFFTPCDLNDSAGLKSMIKNFDPEYVYHLGARTDLLGSNLSSYSANTDGVVNLRDAFSDLKNLRRVIFASSRLVCRIGYLPTSDTDYCPTTPYGESKVVGEGVVRSLAGVSYDWVIVRPTSIWGPWFNIPYRTFFDHVRAKRYMHPKSRPIKKSFGYVGNSVFQLRKILSAESSLVAGRTFYIGDYEPIEVLSFSQKVATAFGVGNVRQVPYAFLKFVAIVGDCLMKVGYKYPPLTSFRLKNLLTPMVHEFSDLPVITGALPFSFDDGIKETVAWMKKND